MYRGNICESKNLEIRERVIEYSKESLLKHYKYFSEPEPNPPKPEEKKPIPLNFVFRAIDKPFSKIHNTCSLKNSYFWEYLKTPYSERQIHILNLVLCFKHLGLKVQKDQLYREAFIDP